MRHIVIILRGLYIQYYNRERVEWWKASRSVISFPFSVKVDVHINNGNYKPIGNGNSIRSDSIKDSGSGTEHAYEQICIRPEENDSVHSSSQKKLNDVSSESR